MFSNNLCLSISIEFTLFTVFDSMFFRERHCPLRYPMLQGTGRSANHRGQPSAEQVQSESTGAINIKGRDPAQVKAMRRAGSRIWADEVQHGIPPLPALRQRQGLHGLRLLRHSLQHKENVLEDRKAHGQVELAYFWPATIYMPDFTPENRIFWKIPQKSVA